ncbi:hypothetical protein H1C71_032652 [Ictidomys tridecemlineatus]|nr:hypothetical protein H1C71_032652 [Ictidomys tridecemlineatus]
MDLGLVTSNLRAALSAQWGWSPCLITQVFAECFSLKPRKGRVLSSGLSFPKENNMSQSLQKRKLPFGPQPRWTVGFSPVFLTSGLSSASPPAGRRPPASLPRAQLCGQPCQMQKALHTIAG